MGRFHKVGSGKPSITGLKPWMARSVLAGLTACARASAKPATSYGLREADKEHLERGKHQARGGAQHSWPDAAGGRASLQGRTAKRSEIYAYEQRKGAKLSGAYEKQFRANKKAWEFFQAQPPWYREPRAGG